MMMMYIYDDDVYDDDVYFVTILQVYIACLIFTLDALMDLV